VDHRTAKEKTDRRVLAPPPTSYANDITKARLFSKCDLKHTYNPLAYYGWAHLVMPVGLANAPCRFQLPIERVSQELLGLGVFIYLDNVLVFAISTEGLCTIGAQVDGTTREHGFTINETTAWRHPEVASCQA
jgi:hypothetical protein